MIVLISLACTPEPAKSPGPLPTEGGECTAKDAVVRFNTQDDVGLEADLQPAASGNRGAVILLHMIPPDNDRTGWKKSVRNSLNDLDLTVLNVDRRGAGGSGGDPLESYEGVGGRRDAEAAVSFLLSGAGTCGVDPTAIAIVGASNGSTSALDYAVAHEADLPDLAALAFLSPGTYTENQFGIDDERAVLDPLRILWLFPTTEDFSLEFEVDGPATWSFIERGTQHGTGMFDGDTLEDDTVADLRDFLAETVAP